MNYHETLEPTMSARTADIAIRMQIAASVRAILRSVTDDAQLVRLRAVEQTSEHLQCVVAGIEEDLLAFSEKDPAAHGSPQLILDTYVSFEAILHYRIARYVLESGAFDPALAMTTAHKLANRGKARTGIDINPCANIGRRFTLDHGYGTVIGETCEIGDDCYVLGGVVLGGLSIAGNPIGKRHPTIGNQVEIGAFARVLGNVTIGDEVFISPHCVIVDDVPARSRVSIVNQMQVASRSGGNRGREGTSSRRLQIFGVVPSTNRCVVHGQGFRDPKVELVDDCYRALARYRLGMGLHLVDAGTMIIELNNVSDGELRSGSKRHLSIADHGETVVILSPFLSRYDAGRASGETERSTQ